jgi:hypothetical protein
MSTPRSVAAPPSSLLLLISWAPSPDSLTTSCSEAAGRGAGRSGQEDFAGREKGGEIGAGGFHREDGGGRTAQFGDILRLLAICRLEAQSLLGSYRRVK